MNLEVESGIVELSYINRYEGWIDAYLSFCYINYLMIVDILRWFQCETDEF